MKNALIRLTITLLLAVSCSGSLFSPDNGPDRIQGNDNLHEMIVLGDKLEDPYSVENMTKALTSLYPTKAGRIQVEPSHLYIRFLPANEQEFDRLVESGIELIDHPVDFQIIREGDYYHDPSLDEDSITWQYAVIAKDFEYPKDIRHEVLDQCYIPIGERDTKAGAGDIDWDAVERQSYMLTEIGRAHV